MYRKMKTGVKTVAGTTESFKVEDELCEDSM